MRRYFGVLVPVFLSACNGDISPEELFEEEQEITPAPSNYTLQTEGYGTYETQHLFGSARVIPGVSFQGEEHYIVGYSREPNDYDFSIHWLTSGTPVEPPPECLDCKFAFDLEFSLIEQGSVETDERAFSYAFGASEYGPNTLFVGWESEWYVGLIGEANYERYPRVFAFVQFDGEIFTYDNQFVDYYYYHSPDEECGTPDE